MKIFYSLIFLVSLITYSQKNESYHYVNKNFVNGKVLMNDGTVYERSLNYNKLTKEIIFSQNSELLAISSYDPVDTVYIDKKKYIRKNDLFLEVVYSLGFNLYVDSYCKSYQEGPKGSYGQSSSNTAVNSLEFYRGKSPIYRKLNLDNDIKLISYLTYYLEKDEVIKSFKSLRQLIKLYPNKKKSIKSYIKSNNTNYKNVNEIKDLVLFIESN